MIEETGFGCEVSVKSGDKCQLLIPIFKPTISVIRGETMTRSSRFRIAICLAILFTLFAYPSPAKACSCIVPGLPSQEFSQANTVFTGRVIRIVDNYYPIFAFLDQAKNKLGMRSHPFYMGKFYGYSVFFTVDKSWKGSNERVVEVHTGYGGGDCGYSFSVGSDYLVYANYAYGKPGNYWITGICSRTAESSNAAEDFTYLNTLPTLALQSGFPMLWTEKDLIILSLLLLPLLAASIVIFTKYQRQTPTKQNTN